MEGEDDRIFTGSIPDIAATNNAVYINVKYQKELAIQLYVDAVVMFSQL